MDIKQVVSGLRIARDDLYRLATDGKDNFEIEAIKTAIYAMHELKEYKQLGTLEKVREAVEKQKRKKPRAINRCFVCPNCGLVTSIKIKHSYCDACGQHINWSDKE